MTTAICSVSLRVIVALVVLCAADSARAQSFDDGVVGLDVRVISAAKATSIPLTYRLYEEARSVSIELSLYNESEKPIIIDETLMKGSFLIRLGPSNSREALEVEWMPGILEPGTLKQLQGGAPLVLEPLRGVAWLVRCTRPAEGLFREGEYSLEIVTRDLSRSIQRADTSVWNGRAPSRTVRFTVVVSPPLNARERAESNALVGDEALARGDDELAATSYQRALASASGDAAIQAKLASTLLQLGRYKQSAQLYEQLLPTLRPGSVAFLLAAKAYLGLADEAGARRVLRLGGLSTARIDDHIKTLRAQDSRLPR
jgi:hypothetical protein